jgi:hypothetical protein
VKLCICSASKALHIIIGVVLVALKGLSHEIEMNNKLYQSTEPNEKMNLLQFSKLSFSSCMYFNFNFKFLQRYWKKVASFLVNGATLLQMSIEVIQYPLTTALEGNPLPKD